MRRNHDVATDVLPSLWLASPAPITAPRPAPTAPERRLRPAQWTPPGATSHREGEAPEAHDRGGRLFFHIVFWFALAASAELWWLNTPAGSISSTGDVLLAGGRLTGMIGGFLLLAQVLLMSRVGWLERWLRLTVKVVGDRLSQAARSFLRDLGVVVPSMS